MLGLEQAIRFINDDELVEITRKHPHAKKDLAANMRPKRTDQEGLIPTILSAIDLVDSSGRLDRIWAFTRCQDPVPGAATHVGFHDEVIAP